MVTMDWWTLDGLREKVEAPNPDYDFDRKKLLRAYGLYGVQLDDRVHVYLALESLNALSEVVFSDLNRPDKHYWASTEMKDLFAHALNWMLHELWLFVPESIKAERLLFFEQVRSENHVEGLNWVKLGETLRPRWDHYYASYVLDPALASVDREYEAEGLRFRLDVSDAEARLFPFFTMYVLLRLASITARLAPAFQQTKDWAIDMTGFEQAVSDRVRMTIAALPDDLRRDLGVPRRGI